MAIYFYSPADEYGVLSTFSAHGLKMNEQWWATVEHYFQAQKFVSSKYVEQIRRANNPKQARMLGRSREMPIRADWDEVKDEIMYGACLRKFETHKDALEILLSTGTQELKLSAPNDYYWGCGSAGTGRNKLGRLLMRIRAELSAHASSESTLRPNSSVKCVTCGHESPPGTKFCPACGSPLDTSMVGPAGELYTPFLPRGVRLRGGAFAVGEVLGQGGFGITYKGGDMTARRYVAIKELFTQGSIRQNAFIHTDPALSLADYNAIRTKFLEEARTLARFSHPSIVQVFEAFEENNTAYMVMEFLEGRSLLQYIHEKGSLKEGEVVDIGIKVGDALSTVHEAGLIHRDIKPDNIMWTNNGRIVLIDFGTARSFSLDKTVRQTAMLTPGYAPLEQYGHHARFGAYTDIYALGATLYHASTGEVPPPATDRVAGVELKPPHLLNPDVSANVSLAIMGAMQMSAVDRPQTVKAFLSALQ